MAPATLCDLLNASARNWPDRVAIGTATGERKATYRDLDSLVRDLSAELHRFGIGRSDTVALFSDNCIEFVVALFGVLSVGAAVDDHYQRILALGLPAHGLGEEGFDFILVVITDEGEGLHLAQLLAPQYIGIKVGYLSGFTVGLEK